MLSYPGGPELGTVYILNCVYLELNAMLLNVKQRSIIIERTNMRKSSIA